MTNPPLQNTQIHQVNNFQDFISTEFHGIKNAICWRRKLLGDFSEIVKQLESQENIREIQEEELRELQLCEEGHHARDILIHDLKLMRDHGASPVLNVIKSYDRDDSYPYFPTDVYSYHVDRSPVPVDTYLCTYYGASSDILSNAQAQQKILIPEIRAELKKFQDGADDDFEAFLSEYFFDLHYQALPDAEPINLGLGHIWRLACDHPESKVPPCIHRAPHEREGEARLLLIC